MSPDSVSTAGAAGVSIAQRSTHWRSVASSRRGERDGDGLLIGRGSFDVLAGTCSVTVFDVKRFRIIQKLPHCSPRGWLAILSAPALGRPYRGEGDRAAAPRGCYETA